MHSDARYSAVQKHENKFGKVEVLVNNASIQVQCENCEEVDIDTLKKTFHPNIFHMFAITT